MMSFEPLLRAPPVIQAHAASAVAAFVLGAVQFSLPKGNWHHRAVGYLWVALMAVVALSSFGIHEIRQWRDFSVIHLLSIFVLCNLPIALLAARRHDVTRHAKVMTSLFIFGLLLAGAFTFLPGRILGRLVFGG